MREPLLRLEELHDFPGGVARRPVEVEVDAHDHVVRVVLGARARDRHVLVQHEAERAGERLLDGRAAHLAVALRAVGVAHVEERAGVEDREVDGRAGGQVLHVEVAAERSPGRASPAPPPP